MTFGLQVSDSFILRDGNQVQRRHRRYKQERREVCPVMPEDQVKREELRAQDAGNEPEG